MPIFRIPAGEFSPDAREYDNGALDNSENLLPIYGSYRPLRQKSVISTQTGDGPMTGTYAHLLLESQAIQVARPDEEISIGNYESSSGASNIYEDIDEVDPDDSDRIVIGGAPTNAQADLGLTTVTDPGIHTGHVLRYRYRVQEASGQAWDIRVDLMEAGFPYAPIIQDNPTGTGNTGWTERTLSLTTGQAAQITTYSDLDVRFDSTVAGSTQDQTPDADIDNPDNWVDEGGATTDLYQSIDEASASDSDYIESPALSDQQVSSVEVGLPDFIDPQNDAGTHTVSFRYQALSDQLTLRVKLMEGSTEIASTEITNAATTWTDGSFNLSTAEAASITDWTDLRLIFEAENPDDSAVTTLNYERPDSDIDDTGWAPTPLWQSLDETSPDDATTEISATVAAKAQTRDFEVGLSDVDDPERSDGHILRVRGKKTPDSGTATYTLKQGASTVATTTVGIGASYTTAAYTLSAAEANSISDYTDLSVKVETDIGGGDVVYYTWIELEVPGPRKVQISWAEFSIPSESRIEYSWLEFEVPDSNTESAGDQVRIYAGSDTKLYEVGSSGWTDRTNTGGDYGGGSDNPLSWDFCSFGSDVVATNYADAVQVLTSGSANFADLITSTAKPQGRFCESVKNFLVLGDILYTAGSPNGEQDEVWWSAQGDNTDFEAPNDTTLSDRQRLLATPGQIMGMVGGEYGVIFKRNSVYRMDFVGAPLAFTFSVISINEGTPYTKSIVPIGNDVYFWGNGGFRVVRSGQVVQPIGDGKVTKFLQDFEFESAAIKQGSSNDVTELDSIVVGAADIYSRLIFWGYQDSDDTFHRGSRLIIYNPQTDQWSPGLDTNLDLSLLANVANIVTDETFLNKGIYGIDYDGTDSSYFKFLSSSTYSATVKTKTISSQSIVGQPGRSIVVTAVRPVWRGHPESSIDPVISVDVEADDSPILRTSRTKTADKTDRDNDDWYSLEPLEGEYFTFETTIPSLTSQTIKEFDGLEVRYEVTGGY